MQNIKSYIAPYIDLSRGDSRSILTVLVEGLILGFMLGTISIILYFIFMLFGSQISIFQLTFMSGLLLHLIFERIGANYIYCLKYRNL